MEFRRVLFRSREISRGAGQRHLAAIQCPSQPTGIDSAKSPVPRNKSNRVECGRAVLTAEEIVIRIDIGAGEFPRRVVSELSRWRSLDRITLEEHHLLPVLDVDLNGAGQFFD